VSTMVSAGGYKINWTQVPCTVGSLYWILLLSKTYSDCVTRQDSQHQEITKK
jgi:hypothetical protein